MVTFFGSASPKTVELWMASVCRPLVLAVIPQVIHSVGNLQVEVGFMARSCWIV